MTERDMEKENAKLREEIAKLKAEKGVPVPARPVAQIQNPVRPPEWAMLAKFQIRADVKIALDAFCDTGDYDLREVCDVAFREYLKLPDPAEAP